MSQLPPLTVSHIVDAYRSYPGEAVRLQTRVKILEAMQGFTLTIAVPSELVITRSWAEASGRGGELSIDAEVRIVEWKEENDLSVGRCYDYNIEAVIDPDKLIWQPNAHPDSDAYRYVDDPAEASIQHDQIIFQSSARVSYEGSEQAHTLPLLTHEQRFREETTQFAVIAKGNYLQYLPALYEQDTLTGRFLMLIESFWNPVETQLRQIHHIFDAQLSPATMLPWLASWYDLELHSEWAEMQKRAVLSRIMPLNRRRGTQSGLKEYLETFTGGSVKVTEYASGSFRIGRDAQLGSGIAFGSSNSPHTFAIQIKAPRISSKCEGPVDSTERQKRLNQLTTLVAAIIEAEKPAHTVCTELTIE